MNHLVQIINDGTFDFIIGDREVRFPDVDMAFKEHIQKLCDKGQVDAAIKFCSQCSSKTDGIELKNTYKPEEEVLMKKSANTTTTVNNTATKTQPQKKEVPMNKNITMTRQQACNLMVMTIHRWEEAARSKGFTLYKEGKSTPMYKCPKCGVSKLLLFTKETVVRKKRSLIFKVGCTECKHVSEETQVSKKYEGTLGHVQHAINRLLDALG